ncbi:MAG: ABC transporter permease subunit [candidate division Zixibacteria bacterium]|nr:ABC transporter permease subunit [candidate division Zixibacteria bacterium]
MTESQTPSPSLPAAAISGDGPVHVRRRLFRDRLAMHCVTLGGMAIILAILAILFVITAEIYPLFRAPSLTTQTPVDLDLPTPPLFLHVDEYREIALIVTEKGPRFVSATGRLLNTPHIPALDSVSVSTVSNLSDDRILLGLSDGRIVPMDISFPAVFDETGKRSVVAQAAIGEAMTVVSGRPVSLLAFTRHDEGLVTVLTTGLRQLTLVTIEETTSPLGERTRSLSIDSLSLSLEGEITSLAVDQRGAFVYAGGSTGQVALVERSSSGVRLAGILPDVGGNQRAAVTALGFLIDDRTLITGDRSGGVYSWQVLEEPGGERKLRRIYAFDRHDRPVTAIASSRRDKGFVTLDEDGTLYLAYGTSGKTLAVSDGLLDRPIALSFAPKADGVFAADSAGRLVQWHVDNPHPEISWRSLFGKIWYEGGLEPEYAWQSTGGTDEFESKLSLTPLIYGTLKGTFYSLLFAIPVAVLAALYVSQFLHPTWKVYVKPVVEIMAALPSVVLGFIAGLWLAPIVERFVPALFLFPVVLSICIFAAYYLWQTFPAQVRARLKPGTEVVLLIPVVLTASGIALLVGGFVETQTMSGDYRNWIYQTLGLTYDQRNSLVVGLAMGFAIIPLMFTIAEDSLSNVPASLVAGSLALGATRWQTALRIVLPSASPGIFSAIMIGFGRAVGETMIVLMATGNTPVMDASIFNGFRALSANIAVELPEAPEGGTLYRVLFLAAFLLFVMTFLVNTVAEVVRLHLRKKYRYL